MSGRAVTVAQLLAAAEVFDLLSAPTRLHLVWSLAAGEQDVTTLAERTGVSIPAASQHLAKLKAAGIVTPRREGRRQLYRVTDQRTLAVVDGMLSSISPHGFPAP
ncbi:winged helix-turn-helix transcriptional regulator [Leucobacter sp. CSA2]|uniref:Winged helix-turn-helix transcriptional regulator n=1 Tax=Leucobacter edaphi TaxID=2796472 RepID=A0A934QDN6_9MICO|nr:winged helix-turn-helix transcriptional regulator [Leucobacter edaphi]